ncbi:GtrA family protein [Candidatus Minimicrobia naudis]|uniref:GtrA family protein n=1 Tax=Candidatus Minimicrobia naudis TaxID=2841263 RepID=A0A8F1MBY6_9BACT|nr:GtrA family protein [Candidatus Minimicrobia naudis]
MQEILKKHADKFRFLIVGSTNTVLDFGILFSLTIFLNIPKEFANFISTFVAFLFSFFANKKTHFQINIQKLKK